MDYEKKYKEAIERARNLKEDPQSVFNEFSPKEGNTICDYIFPELKKSEDERIRKELIDFLEYYRLNNVLDSKTIFLLTDSVAWLERQGEQEEPQVYETKDGEVITYSESDGYKVIDPHFRKPIDKVEQKPAWSREDEQNLNACFGYIPDEFLRRWLTDAIHTRYDKPAKWSEEDEKMVTKICQNLFDYPHIKSPFDNESFIEAQKEVQFIKSLKDRYTWKPSEEQMEALDRAQAELCSTEYNKPICDLIESLNKLRYEQL